MKYKIYITIIAVVFLQSVFIRNIFADPIISGVSDITAEATSSLGAYVSFSSSADDGGAPVPVDCSPLSDSLFSLGETMVDCSATNGSTTTAISFKVKIVDTTPPAIFPPESQTFATSTFPAFPALALAVATDTVDSSPTVSYAPVSFSAGTTTVIWKAVDSSGNENSTTSVVFIADTSSSSPALESATIVIRDNGKTAGPFSIILPAIDAGPTMLAPTGATTTYAVPARSVLALLSSIASATSSFFISNLQYYDSFSSFVVNCIAVPKENPSPDCYNWTYAIDGEFPFVGMDKYSLGDKDTAYIFFGGQWQISTDKTGTDIGEPIIVTAEIYDPVTGLYVPAGGKEVGAVQFDSNFVPTEFATSTTDVNGRATLILNTAGSFDVGITESGYYPNSSILISTSTVAVSGDDAGGGSSSGSGGGGVAINNRSINVDKAFQFLADSQKTDGSFGSPLFTDWGAIALASGPQSVARGKISAYLKNEPDNFQNVTDYERHAMALLSLGINPYNGATIDYINKIVSAFDGVQIGDPLLVNDDIFAIFPLLKSGYFANDSIIQKIIAFIISKQKNDGSFEESVDLTASAIQALSLTPSLPNVNIVLSKARTYLASQQKFDGGFDNSDATSWTLQAIKALGESNLNWTKNNNTPNNFLSGFQQDDGGLLLKSTDLNFRIWTTAYAIPAALNKTWNDILVSFPKPQTKTAEVSGASGGFSASVTESASVNSDGQTDDLFFASTTVATSTAEVSTSTDLSLSTSTASIKAVKKNVLPSAPLKKKNINAGYSELGVTASASVNRQFQIDPNSQLAGAGTSQTKISLKSVVSIFIGLVLTFFVIF